VTTELGYGRGWAADDAAQSIFRIDTALGRPLQITSAGRTKAQNDALIARWNAGDRTGLSYKPSATSPHLSGEAIDSNDHAWLLAHGAEFGFIHDVAGDLVHFVYHANRDTHIGGSSTPPAIPAQSGWQVGQTDFKGTYGENNLNGAKWYCIEPATNGSKTIWAVATQYGVSLADVAAWTAKVAASKWGGELLQDGSSWWDGSGTYYAGVCIALNDVAAALDAFEAQGLAAAAAATAPSTPAPEPTTAAQRKATPMPTQAEIDAAVAALKAAGINVSAGLPGNVLAGLFSGHVTARRRAYFTYSITALVISFGPDIALAGFLSGHQLTVFTASLTLAASIVLKVGTAFGFIAASNTK
jgi:hypothetical protein